MENPERNIHEEIVERLVTKVDELEKREVKFPDYKPQFQSLEKMLEGLLHQS